MHRPILTSLVALASLVTSLSAQAHISLDEPKGRYWDPAKSEADANSPQKQAPCGKAGDSRTTNPALITTYEPGQTITVRWHETIGHPGHYRIAFLEDGQDFPPGTTDPVESPQLPILKDGIEDKAGKGQYSVEVTLPDVECNNCTLQLIQVMTDNPTQPYYYQCADLILTHGDGGSGGASSGGSGGTTTMGGAGGMPSAGAGNGGSGGAASGGTSAGAPSGGSGGAPATGGGAGGSPGSAGSAGALASAGSGGANAGGTAAAGQANVAGSPAAGSPSIPSAGAPAAPPPPSDEPEGGCALPGRARSTTSLPWAAAAAVAFMLARRRRTPRAPTQRRHGA